MEIIYKERLNPFVIRLNSFLLAILGLLIPYLSFRMIKITSLENSFLKTQHAPPTLRRSWYNSKYYSN